ncbi:Ldh family oxidoreductase [Idiomarina zobellii]|uniref:Lactate dehydrogenase n=1 Tax=Idiomarina zobellii TaxID=86103 RepID=A0A837NGQ3_9GAMM|nr:Ldh family oxidoreductase [Idiomarina zobellii]KPD23365.1 lactate dehydrogenase [Idiomarina zobellii]SDF98675.1 Malate/lactate/ureidoglycolate dehydrogenase, LDH2 family [Idiomarina zobellii]
MNTDVSRFDYSELAQWAQSCLTNSGASGEVARNVAYYLLEGDLLGFSTHGLIRLLNNCQWLKDGKSLPKGQPVVLSERAAVANWDAQFLPGPYVVPQAVNAACDMAKQAGTGTVVLRRSQHVASLAAYLTIATDKGMVVNLMCSTPGQRAVAPFGGKEAVFSPNPFAVGVPSSKEPMLFDISFSMTAAGKVRQAKANGEKLPYKALIKPNGEWTDDPLSFFESPGSAIAPLGGEQLGYKGYGLTLFSEIWSMALAQYGRVQGADDGDANTVWVQVIDPAAFGDKSEFLKQVDSLLDDARNSAPADSDAPVRVPGEAALARKREQLKKGVIYAPSTLKVLKRCAEFCGVELPKVATG